MRQFSNSFPKHFSYLCKYAFICDLSCSFCEYPISFHCLHCSPSCFDPDLLLFAYFWLGLSWIDSISANKRFSSSKTSSRKPYTYSKQQEKQKHSAENTINFSRELKMSRGVLKMSRRELKLSRREWIFTWRELKMSRGELKISRRELKMSSRELQMDFHLEGLENQQQ